MRASAVALCAMAFTGCVGDEAKVGSDHQKLISDAVHNGGRPGFYFLPPLVDPPPLLGTFDGGHSLAMTVRVLDGAELATIPMTTASDQYHALWDTDGLPGDDTIIYRVTVVNGALELGFLDVRIFASRQEAKSLASDDFIELVEGKKLHVKVWINTCGAVTCDDGDPSTDDSCDLILGCVHVPSPTCDDGDACTTDAREATGCVHTPVDCDDGDAVTFDGCEPASGCTHTSCDDGDACTTDGTDLIGCVHGAVDCNDGNACTEDACDAAAGCTSTPVSCDDGNACTADACDAASGCTSTPVSCDDGNACTNDVCDAASGCMHGPLDCNDGNPCTDDGCNTSSGCFYMAASCDDGNACTADTCDVATGCAHGSISCDDGDPATFDSCNPASGCVNESCDDDNACTVDGSDGSGCTHSPVSCNDDDACTDDLCDAVNGCVHPPASCNDGNACTADACDSTAGCTHGPIPCDDDDPCTLDSCDPVSGCAHVFDEVACNASLCGSTATLSTPLATDWNFTMCGDLPCILATTNHDLTFAINRQPEVRFRVRLALAAMPSGTAPVPLHLVYERLSTGSATLRLLHADGTAYDEEAVSDVYSFLGSNTVFEGNYLLPTFVPLAPRYYEVRLPATGQVLLFDAIDGQLSLSTGFDCSDCGGRDDGAGCTDDNACTIGDACLAGVCSSSPLSCDDGDPSTADACDPSTGGCTHL